MTKLTDAQVIEKQAREIVRLRYTLAVALQRFLDISAISAEIAKAIEAIQPKYDEKRSPPRKE